MNRYYKAFGFFTSEYTFDEIKEIEDLGFCYLIYVSRLTRLKENGKPCIQVFGGIMSIQIDKNSTIMYNDISYDIDSIGKLIMLIENEHLKKALDSL
jgi:hypothetical protein